MRLRSSRSSERARGVSTALVLGCPGAKRSPAPGRKSKPNLLLALEELGLYGRALAT